MTAHPDNNTTMINKPMLMYLVFIFPFPFASHL